MEWDDEAVRRISGSAFCGMFHPREILHQTTCWNVDGYVWPGLQRLRETSLCDWRRLAALGFFFFGRTGQLVGAKRRHGGCQQLLLPVLWLARRELCRY